MQNTLRPHVDADDNRHFSFERCFNFRDLGGYTTRDGRSLRWRRLFRSMTPEWMSTEDATEARALGIELVVDLRGPDYVTSGPVGEQPAQRLNVGFHRGAYRETEAGRALLEATAIDGLPMVLDLYAPHFATAVAAMSQARGAVLYHCQLGKDRTGILSALILELCGVDDEQIVADYMLTEAREPLCRALIAACGEPMATDGGARFVREPVQPEAMRAVLQKLREQHGGARGFLTAHGVDGAELDAWMERLLQ